LFFSKAFRLFVIPPWTVQQGLSQSRCLPIPGVVVTADRRPAVTTRLPRPSHQALPQASGTQQAFECHALLCSWGLREPGFHRHSGFYLHQGLPTPFSITSTLWPGPCLPATVAILRLCQPWTIWDCLWLIHGIGISYFNELICSCVQRIWAHTMCYLCPLFGMHWCSVDSHTVQALNTQHKSQQLLNHEWATESWKPVSI
jgi:hypothetical protein